MTVTNNTRVRNSGSVRGSERTADTSTTVRSAAEKFNPENSLGVRSGALRNREGAVAETVEVLARSTRRRPSSGGGGGGGNGPVA